MESRERSSREIVIWNLRPLLLPGYGALAQPNFAWLGTTAEQSLELSSAERLRETARGKAEIASQVFSVEPR